jgi:hypothetical protein
MEISLGIQQINDLKKQSKDALNTLLSEGYGGNNVPMPVRIFLSFTPKNLPAVRVSLDFMLTSVKNKIILTETGVRDCIIAQWDGEKIHEENNPVFEEIYHYLA